MSGNNGIGEDNSKISKAVQTVGTILILASWFQVAMGNSIHSEAWYVVAYPWNMVLEVVGCGLWAGIGFRWRNLNVICVNGLLCILASIGIWTNLV